MTFNTTRGVATIDIFNVLVGLVVFIMAVALFIMYGLPALKDTNTEKTQQEEKSDVKVEVNFPLTGTSSNNMGSPYKD